MQLFLAIVGLLMVLVIIGLLLQPATWMWWALGVLVVLGIGAPVVGFALRGNAPDDKFPWE